MAETPSKRLREENSPEDSNSKRQKPYTNILNFLDDDDSDPAQDPSPDLSAMFTILQQEVLSPTTTTTTTTTEPPLYTAADDLPLHQTGNENESVESVMRHLLEASDDELGIPNPRDENDSILSIQGDNFPFTFNENVLWDLEDEAANYYTVLQSELFM